VDIVWDFASFGSILEFCGYRPTGLPKKFLFCSAEKQLQTIQQIMNNYGSDAICSFLHFEHLDPFRDKI